MKCPKCNLEQKFRDSALCSTCLQRMEDRWHLEDSALFHLTDLMSDMSVLLSAKERLADQLDLTPVRKEFFKIEEAFLKRGILSAGLGVYDMQKMGMFPGLRRATEGERAAFVKQAMVDMLEKEKGGEE
jgi:hypothetical protein